MAKRPSPVITGADSRPRIYFRARGDQMQVAGHPSGPWTPVYDFFAAIDGTTGEEGAWKRKAVILWEGASTDA